MNINLLSSSSLSLLFFIYLSQHGNGAKITHETINSPEVKTVFVNGDSIHYIDIGKGTPVIFIHGALADYRGFSGQRDDFSKSHRVIIYSRRYAFPDNRPISDSFNYRIDPHVNDLIEFIKVLNLGTVHLIGHSYGAFIALRIALDHPELVRSVTLCEPPYPSLTADSIWQNFVTKFKNPAAEAFKRGDDKKAMEIFVHGVIGDSLFFPQIPSENVKAFMENIPELRAIALTSAPFPKVTCQELLKMKVPVLLVGGDKSPPLFTASTAELDRCLRYNEVLLLHNTSHALQNQNPSEFNKTVLQFIGRY